MKSLMRKLLVLVAALAITGSVVGQASAEPSRRNASIGDRVNHELLMLPYVGVFDSLSYKIDGSTVTLYGKVLRPTMAKEAAARVSKISGVTRVVNDIEVLPVSSFDDSIRARTYRAIFSTGGLYRYSMGSYPSIHIVVERGHVTLEGAVQNRMDSQLAYMAANQVPGVFSVTNRLHIINQG